MVEAMSSILYILAQTLSGDGARVSLVQFDYSAIVAYDSKVAINGADLKDLATTLSDKLYQPRGGGTMLSSGLKAVNFSNKIHFSSL